MSKWYEKIGYSLIGLLTWILISIVFSTYKVMMFGREVEKEYLKQTNRKGVLLASWHRGLFFSCYFYRYLQYVVMLSAGKDGDLFCKAVQRFGWIPVRGSSSRRGSEALREMEDLFLRGHGGGIVVDAPKGPAHKSKIGIIVLARRTGLPVFPVMWSAERYWRIKNWDGSIVPKPFSRIVYLYAAKPLYVSPDATPEECENKRQELDTVLNRLMYQADHFFRTPDTADPRQITPPDEINSWLAATGYGEHRRVEDDGVR